jgi:hypothetical protein
MGMFVPATMMVSCLTALTLLPSLVLLLHPRFIFVPAKETSATDPTRAAKTGVSPRPRATAARESSLAPGEQGRLRDGS